MTIKTKTKIYEVECCAVITGDEETKESALATFKEEFARGNYSITVKEVKDKKRDKQSFASLEFFLKEECA
jgi:hypothetical protein